MTSPNPYQSPKDSDRSHTVVPNGLFSVIEILIPVFVTLLAFWRWAKYSDIGGSLMFPIVFNMVVLIIVASLFLIGTQRVVKTLPTQMRLTTYCDVLAIVTCLLCSTHFVMHLKAFHLIGGTGTKEMQQIMRREGVDSANVSEWFRSIDNRIWVELSITLLVVLLMCGKIWYDSVRRQRTAASMLTTSPEVAEHMKD
jgi:hypothetical protein